MSGANRLAIIYARRPVAGQVKSRLAAGIGAEDAARLYARLLDRLVARFDRGAAEHGFAFHLHVDPADAVDWFAQRYPTLRGRIVAQSPHADLGARMIASFEHGFGRGFRQVAIMCSDAPELEPTHPARAFTLLLHHDAVFGPAADGGYYLVAWKRLLPELFASMRWSQPDVWEQTRARAASARLDLGLLPPLADIDTEADLQRLGPALRQDLRPQAPRRPPRA